RLDEARRAGRRLLPQTTCRPSLMDFRLSEMGLFDALPSWQAAAGRSGEALRAIFRDPAFRAAFRKDLGPEFTGYRLFKGDWDGIRVLVTGRPELRHMVGRSVGEIAAERGADPLDALLDVALEDGLQMQFSYMLASDLGREGSLLDDDYLL